MTVTSADALVLKPTTTPRKAVSVVLKDGGIVAFSRAFLKASISLLDHACGRSNTVNP